MPALAASEQVVRPYLGYAFAHEDNVLGVDESGADAGASSSSNTQQASAGVLVNKRISQQVLSGAFHFNRNRYDELPQLNHDAKNLRVNWNWHLGERVDGNLGTSYVKSLAPFVNFHARERNLRVERRQFADAGWLVHPSWRLRSGVSRSDLEHELVSQQSGDRVEQVGELGLDYLAKSGSTVGTQLRHTRGTYPHPQQIGASLVDNSYVQDEIKVKINWLVTRQTQLQFLGGPVKRRHDAFAARDYSGLNARLQASWQTTPALGLGLGLWREIGALDDVTISYTLNQGASLGSTWNASEKVRVDALLKVESSQYSGTEGLVATEPQREDTLRSALVKVQYRVTEHMTLAGQAYSNKRTSTLAGNSYPVNGMQLSLKYEF